MERKIIGIIKPQKDEAHDIKPLYLGARLAAKERGISLMFFSHSDTLNLRELSGICFIKPKKEASLSIKHLTLDKFPTVAAWSNAKFDCVPQIDFDNHAGIIKATDHLVSLGHKQIGFLKGSDDDELAKQRYEGYLEALKIHNIDFDPNLVISGNMNLEQTQIAVKEILERKVQFTALIAANDSSAIGAISALRSKGLNVPKDISVFGFDNFYDVVHQSDPPLSTVSLPTFEMGYRAIDLLHKQQESPETVPEERILIEPPLSASRIDQQPFKREVVLDPGKRKFAQLLQQDCRTSL